MKYSTREDIEAPIEVVFAALSDFETFERSAMRRGAEVVRREARHGRETVPGWEIAFPFRGKRRELTAALVEFEGPTRLRLDSESSGLNGQLAIDLVALSRNRTRLGVQLELRPRTLSARLMLQSLKLAKANLTRRFRLRVANFATSVEDAHKGAGTRA